MTGSLSPGQVESFNREGYLILRGVLDKETVLDPIVAEYAMVLDRLANELHERGEISSTYADLPYSDRITRIWAETGKDYTQYFDFTLPQSATKADTPFWTGPAVFALLRNEGILDAVESLIGPEIYANPVQHVRLKPPEQLLRASPTGEAPNNATPWHQDNGVVTEDADETDMITVWLPLTNASVENGCLVVQPNSHHEGLLPHCPSDAPARNRNGGTAGLHIPDAFLAPEEVSVDAVMEAGDILLMHRRTPHASHRNTADYVRWSFDLRYNPTGQPSGRSAFPGFVARSAAEPWTELHDPVAWTDMWLEARARVSGAPMPAFNRWDRSAVTCA
ncbi:MAG TPA: phytanoyl-CoA dioxygenase family protein [Thermomicrobiales bacterium]|nr:phytanoyl-CoA dioxygenase family protein [Thermomicrobiales bacterium]